MTTIAGMPNVDIGLHLGTGDFSNMSFGPDMLLDPRMELPLFGIKNEKDSVESPGHFALTPHMFDSVMEHRGGNSVDCMSGSLPSSVFGRDNHLDTTPIMHAGPDRTSPTSLASAPSPATQTSHLALVSPPPPGSFTAASEVRDKRKKRPGPTKSTIPAPTTRSAENASGPSDTTGVTARTRSKRDAASSSLSSSIPTTKRAQAKEAREEARRNRCLERNRIAASKCREKKKAWMQDLETTKAELESQHASLQREYNGLLEEATQIKTSLMAHAACNDQNIDMWIESEAVRFVRRANKMHHDAAAGPVNTCQSSIASLASLQSQNESLALSSTGQSDITQLSSPVLDSESAKYDFAPSDMFPDEG